MKKNHVNKKRDKNCPLEGKEKDSIMKRKRKNIYSLMKKNHVNKKRDKNCPLEGTGKNSIMKRKRKQYNL